jgi:hypothetical protein
MPPAALPRSIESPRHRFLHQEHCGPGEYFKPLKAAAPKFRPQLVPAASGFHPYPGNSFIHLSAIVLSIIFIINNLDRCSTRVNNSAVPRLEPWQGLLRQEIKRHNNREH